MASLYIHIPFCKKACHYCSFYFVLTQTKKEEFVKTLCQEIEIRNEELKNQEITSIYFGGGTPSILSYKDLEDILKSIYKNYNISPKSEISIETNPENLNEGYLRSLRQLSINRLSIGVQSFFDEDLTLMNRNHSVSEAENAILQATQYFENVSVDLMFGLPYSGMNRWKDNLQKAVNLGVKHISTYNLTVEEKTALARKVKRNELPIEEDNTLNEMYFYTLDYLESKGFNQYEISNFGKPNYWSHHNIGYWKNIHYLGFGPSAHSYNGAERRWNISNLNKYITSISSQDKYWENEVLSIENQYNEYVMTRMRTIFGVDIREIKANFGENLARYFEHEVEKFITNKQINQLEGIYTLTNKGKVVADFMSSELMIG